MIHQPCIYLAVLNLMGSFYDTQKFKRCRNDYENCIFYALFYLEPMFNDLRLKGKITVGETEFKGPDGWYDYKGEIDERGQPCGQGIATPKHK